jgi:prepilin-type N-terminal cleavage/methylation domain-containing protein
MFAAYLVSWTAGAFALAAWVVIAWGGALLRRNRLRKGAQAGFTLIEVLLALGIIAALIAPALGSFSVMRNAAVNGERRTQQVALARARLSQISEAAFTSGAASIASVCTNATGDQSGLDILNDASLAIYSVNTAMVSAGSGTCVMRVTVSCPTCRTTSGQVVPNYTTQSVIRKKTNGGG